MRRRDPGSADTVCTQSFDRVFDAVLRRPVADQLVDLVGTPASTRFVAQRRVRGQLTAADQRGQCRPRVVAEHRKRDPIVVDPAPVDALRAGARAAVSVAVQLDPLLRVFQHDLGGDVQCRLHHRRFDLHPGAGAVPDLARRDRRERRMQARQGIADPTRNQRRAVGEARSSRPCRWPAPWSARSRPGRATGRPARTRASGPWSPADWRRCTASHSRSKLAITRGEKFSMTRSLGR